MLTQTKFYTQLPVITQEFTEIKTPINQPTGRFFYDPWEIKPEFKDTELDHLLESLPVQKGEARIINMAPGVAYRAHSDADNRWHLNLSGEYCFLVDLDNNEMHSLVPDGNWYFMDAGRIHTAVNFGSKKRLQLVVRQLLTESESCDTVNVVITPNNQRYDIRYIFDLKISPHLNYLNNISAMKNFSYTETSVSFDICKTCVDLLPRDENFNLNFY